MLTLALPWSLLLLPLPLLIHWLSPAQRSSREAVRIPFLQRLAQISGQAPTDGSMIRRRQRRVWVLLIGSWVAVVLACCRPQWIGAAVVQEQPGRDLLLAVDLSGSMAEEDFTLPDGSKSNRLQATKAVLGEFIQQRQHDRLGLIFFGDIAVLQAPPTTDHQLVLQLLDEASVAMAGPKTAIGDALGLAIRQLERSELQEQVVILLTDGNDTGSLVPPTEAASLAAQAGVTVHCIAVGDPSSVGEEAIDEALLRSLSKETGGQFFSAMDRDDLAAIYTTLDQLEERLVEVRKHHPRQELFMWPLAVVLLLTMASQVLVLKPPDRQVQHAH